MNQRIIKELQRQSSVKHNTLETIGRLQRTIKRLSQDLYASESHYLYELIQNADDNKYSKGITPKLRIELKLLVIEGEERTCLILNNNEDGFSERDVRAICDVDASTKSIETNTIGEKGIGFKSVFRITDCPYILSNDYAFKLPEINPNDADGLGYIIPYLFPSSNISRVYNTCIILPVNKVALEQIIRQLKELNENSILFLRRLKYLEIDVDILGNIFSKIVERKDEGHFRFLYVEENNQTKKLKFFIYEALKNRPNDVSHENREDVESRAVSIAIPLFTNRIKGVLYSYLPVWEDTGLPFMINSDFLLTSDRENLHKDYEWNKWLRDEISSVYCEGIESILHNRITTIEERISVYKSIPLSSNESFLDSVVEDIIEKLKRKPILPAFKTNSFFAPSEIKIAFNDLLELFLSSTDYPLAIKEDKFPLLSLEVVTEATEKVFERLEVQVLYLEEFGAQFLSDNSWMQDNSYDWFVSLFEYLRSQNFSKNALKKFKIVPANNSLRSAKETNLYLKIKDNEILKNLSDENIALLKIEEVSQGFINMFLSEDKKERKLWLKEYIGIHEFIPRNLGNTILDLIRDHHKELSLGNIIKLTEHLYNLDKNLLSDKNLILVDDNQELFDPENEDKDIVVPQSFNEESGWQHIFIEGDRGHFKIISERYSRKVIEELIKGKSRLKLYPSFKKNILQSYLIPKTESGKELISYLKRKSAYEHVGSLEAYEFLNPQSFSRDKLSPQVSRAILAYLKSRNFKERSSWSYEISESELADAGFLNEGLYYYRGKNKVNCESSISLYIKNEPWLYIEKFGFQVPSSVFLKKNEISEVLGDSVPYVDGLENQVLIKFLGIKSELTRQSLIDYLIDAQKGQADIEGIINIYSQLDQRTNDDNWFTDDILSRKLIYLDSTEKWITPKECIWEDPKGIADDLQLNVLSTTYPETLKEFFVNKLNVPESLDIGLYVSRWEQMQKDNEATEDVLEQIYRKVKRHIIKKDDDVVNNFMGRIKIYSFNKKEFYNPIEVYFPDDIKLKNLFKDEVPLAYHPKGDGYSAWIDFYNALNVPILSEYIETKVCELPDLKLLEENKFLTPQAIKLIAAYIKTKNREGYDELLKNDSFLSLVKTREYESGSDIPLIIHLNEEYQTEIESSVYFSLKAHQLYFKKGADQMDIALEIYNAFNKQISLPPDAKNSIELFLEESSLKRKDRNGLDTPKEVYEMLKNTDKQVADDTKLGKEQNGEDDTKTKGVIEDDSKWSQDQETDSEENPDKKSTTNKEGKIAEKPKGKIKSTTPSKPDFDKPKRKKEKEIDNTRTKQQIPTTKKYEPQDLNTYRSPSHQKPKIGKRRTTGSRTAGETSSQSKIENEERKLGKERDNINATEEYLARKSKLHKALENESTFTFRKLKNLTELEYLEDQKSFKANSYNLTFNRVRFEKKTVFLDFPNRLVSTNIEQYENLKLILYTVDKTITLSLQSVSVNRYRVRAKLWAESDIKDLEESNIEKAVLKIESVDFLWKTLLDQLYEIEKDKNINPKSLLLNLIKKYRKVAFLFGPPGTGKTTTIINDHLLPDLERNNKRCLVLTPTNKAADVITSRLIESNTNGNYFRFGNTGSEIIEKHDCFIGKEKMNKRYQSYTLITTIARFPYDIIEFNSASSVALRDENWDKIILDEASMINLPQIIGLILSVSKETEIIIVGDPFQIKPILQLREWTEENIYDLVGLKSFKTNKTKRNNYLVKSLGTQYRSLKLIGQLFSDYSYEKGLNHARRGFGKPNYFLFNDMPLVCTTILRFPVDQTKTLYSSKYLNKSSYHLYLALFLVEWLIVFVEQFPKTERKKIGIISPYRAHSDLLYKLVNANQSKLENCEILVSTVHGFQGDECDIIICALNPPKGINQKATLNDKNVLNVAISRARDYLILFMPDNYKEYKELKKISSLVKYRSHKKYDVKDVEKAMFGSSSYIEESTYATAHHPINVFGSSTYKYEIRIEDDALDIQINDHE